MYGRLRKNKDGGCELRMKRKIGATQKNSQNNKTPEAISDGI
jgi:hypothetical protein